MTAEDTVRAYYRAWENKEWPALTALLAEGFAFSGANDDHRLDLRSFRAKCWPQAEWIGRFELESVCCRDHEAFVKYRCWTLNGGTFHNIEHFQFAAGKVASIECYFGDVHDYPSAASDLLTPPRKRAARVGWW
jgi:hypothetical protein